MSFSESAIELDPELNNVACLLIVAVYINHYTAALAWTRPFREGRRLVKGKTEIALLTHMSRYVVFSASTSPKESYICKNGVILRAISEMVYQK